VLEPLARATSSLPYQKGILWLTFSPDGRLLAVANLDGGIHLLEFPSGRVVTELKGHAMGCSRALFFPDGKTLVTGSWDGKIKLWDCNTYQELITLPLPPGATFRSLDISGDGRTLAVGYRT